MGKTVAPLIRTNDSGDQSVGGPTRFVGTAIDSESRERKGNTCDDVFG